MRRRTAVATRIGVGVLLVVAVAGVAWWLGWARGWAALNENERGVGVLSTVAVAAFTGMLWWSTRKMWKAGEQQRELMAAQLVTMRRQADQADREFESTHRPRLQIRRVNVQRLSGASPPKTEITQVCCEIVNVGESDATIEAGSGLLVEGGSQDWPSPAILRDENREVYLMPKGLVSNGTPVEWRYVLVDRQRDALTVRRTRVDVAPLWFVGFVRYRDRLGRAYETAFSRLYNPRNEAFSPNNGPADYEYED